MFYRTFLLSNSPQRKKFSSQFFGKNTKMSKNPVDNHSNKEIIVIQNPAEFKRNCVLIPVPLYTDLIPVMNQQSIIS